jgi:hypothetical protein
LHVLRPEPPDLCKPLPCLFIKFIFSMSVRESRTIANLSPSPPEKIAGRIALIGPQRSTMQPRLPAEQQ